jgi:hypothetical protein
LGHSMKAIESHFQVQIWNKGCFGMATRTV